MKSADSVIGFFRQNFIITGEDFNISLSQRPNYTEVFKKQCNNGVMDMYIDESISKWIETNADQEFLFNRYLHYSRRKNPYKKKVCYHSEEGQRLIVTDQKLDGICRMEAGKFIQETDTMSVRCVTIIS